MSDPLLRALCLNHSNMIPPRLLATLLEKSSRYDRIKERIKEAKTKPEAPKPEPEVRVVYVQAAPVIESPVGVPLTTILQAVCKYYGVTKADVVSHRRSAKVVRPRQVFMYLARELTPHSMPVISRLLGDRDHTTVLHGIRKIEKLRMVSPEVEYQVATLLENLTPREVAA